MHGRLGQMRQGRADHQARLVAAAPGFGTAGLSRRRSHQAGRLQCCCSSNSVQALVGQTDRITWCDQVREVRCLRLYALVRAHARLVEVARYVTHGMSTNPSNTRQPQTAAQAAQCARSAMPRGQRVREQAGSLIIHGITTQHCCELRRASLSRITAGASTPPH